MNMRANISAKTSPSLKPCRLRVQTKGVRHEGNLAWATATTHAQGNLNGHKIDSSGVELIVLTKQDGKWRIRAIHWSSHANKSDEIK